MSSTETFADTYALHCGANERRQIMLKKLGGDEKRREAIDRFYEKQMNDPRLVHFFDGSDLEIIKWHQFNLMSIAFTAVPKTVDIGPLLLTRHIAIFDQGLDETHFDLVADHFTTTLKEMKVDGDVIQEALDVVMPLRNIFKEGARRARERKRKAEFHSRLKIVAVVAVVAAVALRFVRTQQHRK